MSSAPAFHQWQSTECYIKTSECNVTFVGPMDYKYSDNCLTCHSNLDDNSDRTSLEMFTLQFLNITGRWKYVRNGNWWDWRWKRKYQFGSWQPYFVTIHTKITRFLNIFLIRQRNIQNKTATFSPWKDLFSTNFLIELL